MTHENTAEKMNVSVWEPADGAQTEALMRSEFEVLVGGQRGGGKTDVGMAWLGEPEYSSNPRYAGLVIRKNADDLRDFVSRIRSFYYGIATVSGKPATVRFHDGGRIEMGHLKDDDAYEKYQGHEYQKILIEELTQIPNEERYLKLLSSARSTIPGLPAQSMSSTNPGGAGHSWVKKRFVDVAREKTYYDPISGRSRIFIPFKLEDNPFIMKHDPEYVRFLESLPERLKQAWRYGNWDVFSGQYFDEWERSVHACRPFSIPKEWRKYVAIDYGTRNPFSAHFYAVENKDSVFCYKEVYETGLNATQQAEAILEMQRDDIVSEYVCDPSMFAKNQSISDMSRYKNVNLESIADQYHRVGINLIPGNNDRLHGCNAIREYLHWEGKPGYVEKHPKLKIFENCENMIRTIPELYVDDKRPELYDTSGEDHAVDDLRYFLSRIMAPSEFKKEIRPMTLSVFEDVGAKPDIRKFW